MRTRQLDNLIGYAKIGIICAVARRSAVDSDRAAFTVASGAIGLATRASLLQGLRQLAQQQQEPLTGAFAAQSFYKHGATLPLRPRPLRSLHHISHGFSRSLHDTRSPSQLGQRDQLSWERWPRTCRTQRFGLESAATTDRARFDAVGETGRTARDTKAIRQWEVQCEVDR